MAIKCRKTQIPNDLTVDAPVFRFREYTSGNTYYNNSDYIDFVTYDGSLYVCVSADGVEYQSGDPAENQFLLLIKKGKDGQKGSDGERGPKGDTPNLSLEFNGDQLVVRSGNERVTSGHLTGNSWIPVLDDESKVIRWIKGNKDEIPSNIPLEDLRPKEEQPIILRLNSDNTKREVNDPEEFGPGTLIQWMREGDQNWRNLMSISELMNLALAGIEIWQEYNQDTDKLEYHVGHKQVLSASYDTRKIGDGEKTVLVSRRGDVLFDAGVIPIPDTQADIEALTDLVNEIESEIPSEETIRNIVNNEIGDPVDLHDIDLWLDENKNLYISYDNKETCELVGRTCECEISTKTKTPNIRVYLNTNGVRSAFNKNYKVNITGEGVNGGPFTPGNYPTLTIGNEYIFQVVPEDTQTYSSSPKSITYIGQDIELDVYNKNTVPVEPKRHLVTIVPNPSDLSVTVAYKDHPEGVTYKDPFYVYDGDSVYVTGKKDGYINAYVNRPIVNTDPDNILISLTAEPSSADQEAQECTVVVRSIVPNGITNSLRIEYNGQDNVYTIGQLFKVNKQDVIRIICNVEGYKPVDKLVQILTPTYYIDLELQKLSKQEETAQKYTPDIKIWVYDDDPNKAELYTKQDALIDVNGAPTDASGELYDDNTPGLYKYPYNLTFAQDKSYNLILTFLDKSYVGVPYELPQYDKPSTIDLYARKSSGKYWTVTMPSNSTPEWIKYSVRYSDTYQSGLNPGDIIEVLDGTVIWVTASAEGYKDEKYPNNKIGLTITQDTTIPAFDLETMGETDYYVLGSPLGFAIPNAEWKANHDNEITEDGGSITAYHIPCYHVESNGTIRRCNFAIVCTNNNDVTITTNQDMLYDGVYTTIGAETGWSGYRSAALPTYNAKIEIPSKSESQLDSLHFEYSLIDDGQTIKTKSFDIKYIEHDDQYRLRVKSGKGCDQNGGQCELVIESTHYNTAANYDQVVDVEIELDESGLESGVTTNVQLTGLDKTRGTLINDSNGKVYDGTIVAKFYLSSCFNNGVPDPILTKVTIDGIDFYKVPVKIKQVWNKKDYEGYYYDSWYGSIPYEEDLLTTTYEVALLLYSFNGEVQGYNDTTSQLAGWTINGAPANKWSININSTCLYPYLSSRIVRSEVPFALEIKKNNNAIWSMSEISQNVGADYNIPGDMNSNFNDGKIKDVSVSSYFSSGNGYQNTGYVHVITLTYLTSTPISESDGYTLHLVQDYSGNTLNDSITLGEISSTIVPKDKDTQQPIE